MKVRGVEFSQSVLRDPRLNGKKFDPLLYSNETKITKKTGTF